MLFLLLLENPVHSVRLRMSDVWVEPGTLISDRRLGWDLLAPRALESRGQTEGITLEVLSSISGQNSIFSLCLLDGVGTWDLLTHEK